MFLSLLLQVNQVQPSLALSCRILVRRESCPHCPHKAHPLCAQWVSLRGIRQSGYSFPSLAIYSKMLLMCFWWAEVGRFQHAQGSPALHRIPHEGASVSQDTGFIFRQTGTSTWFGTWKAVQQNKYVNLNLKHFHGISPDPHLCNC